MEKEFVTYEQVIALQELGVYIPPPCYTVYRKYPNMDAVLLVNPGTMETLDIVAPLKQQVFKLFREHNLYVEIGHSERVDFYYAVFKNSEVIADRNDYSTYEEAENACIDKLIEIAKNK